jgi:hypothetical protein
MKAALPIFVLCGVLSLAAAGISRADPASADLGPSMAASQSVMAEAQKMADRAIAAQESGATSDTDVAMGSSGGRAASSDTDGLQGSSSSTHHTMAALVLSSQNLRADGSDRNHHSMSDLL